MASKRSASGFTLVELLISLAVSLIIGTLAVATMVELDRDQAKRQKITDLQTNARIALGYVETDLTHGSLAVGSGVVWTSVGGARVSRPAVQIFWNVPGTGFLDVKPNTDAVLVVGARRGVTSRSALRGDVTTTTGAIALTDATPFSAGLPVLLGDFSDASWGVVDTVTASGTAQQLTLADSAVNVIPGVQVQRLRSGASVRAAQARLYYVNTADELVRLSLTVPRAPATIADVAERYVVGRGFENLKLDCQIDNFAGGFTACPDALVGDPVATESQAAFGAFGAAGTHQGPAFNVSNVGLVRLVVLDVLVRSRTPLASGAGDPKLLLGRWPPATPLPVGGGSDTADYVRRMYRVTAGVRNTSLGAI